MSSSSSPMPPGRFIAWFVATAGLIALILLGAALLADPRGLLAASHSRLPRVCADGIKTSNFDAAPFLPAIHRPREIFLGTSRVYRGFSSADANALLSPPVVNMGAASATLEEVHQLFEQALRDAPVRRAWIGIDFGMFYRPEPQRRLERPGDVPPHLFPFRYGAADEETMRIAPFVLAGRSCAEPPADLFGFARQHLFDGGLMSRQVPDTLDEFEAKMAASFNAPLDPALYRSRMARVGVILDSAAIREVQLILFVNPSHPRYHSALDRAGLADSYRRWREDIRRLADRHSNVVFMDFGEPDPRFAPGGCRESGKSPDCPFFDLTHYRQRIGRRIIEAGLREAALR